MLVDSYKMELLPTSSPFTPSPGNTTSEKRDTRCRREADVPPMDASANELEDETVDVLFDVLTTNDEETVDVEDAAIEKATRSFGFSRLNSVNCCKIPNYTKNKLNLKR